MWIVCITSVRHVLTVNGYGGRQTKENEKSWCFKGWETLVKYDFEAVYCIFKGSSEIWSDKVSLLHIKVTQRGGEHGGESRQYHRGAEGTKSDRAVVYVLLITLVKNVL